MTRIFPKSKKGALELSMQSIIVFVLAIIVMSALVVAIHGILGGITADKIQQLSGGTQLPRTAASYSDPITIAEGGSSLTLSPLAKDKKFAFDFFNSGNDISGTAGTPLFLKLNFDKCYSSDGTKIDAASKLPKVTSVFIVTKNLPQGSDLQEGQFRVTEQGLDPGNYDCVVSVYKLTSANQAINAAELRASKSITLTVG